MSTQEVIAATRPLENTIQALEVRLETATTLLGKIYKHIYWAVPSEKMAEFEETNWQLEAQRFLAERK